MTSVFPSCLSSSALRFSRTAGHWAPQYRSDNFGIELERDHFEPSPVALKLAEDVLPQNEKLRETAVRYLEVYTDARAFSMEGEWSVESMEFDLPPLLAPDQFTLCLRHPRDPRALWRVIFHCLPANEAVQEKVVPIAVHREVRRWEW